ncbi:MAG: small-conductance mechanosensitive channel [Halieaceae bacterium]|jgi:small-conductance mechanosensitive channel
MISGATIGFSQELLEGPMDSIALENTLSINEISGETESLRSRIKNLREILTPNAQTLEIDSIIDTVYVNVRIEKDSLYEEIEILSRRELKIREVMWIDFKSKLKAIQETLNKRNQEVNNINEELILERKRWMNTKRILEQNTESEDVFSSLDTMIVTLNSLIDYSHTRLDSLFRIEKKITELILIVDEASSEIVRFERQKQKDYFVLDSAPIWEVFKSDSSPMDTAAIPMSVIQPNPIIQGVKEDYKNLKIFIDSSIQPLVLQLLVLLIIFIILLLIRSKWSLTELPIDSLNLNQIQVILTNPFSATLLIGVLMSFFFYSAVVPSFIELQVLLVLSAAAFLMPKFTHKDISLFMFLILLGYVIQVIEPYFIPRSNAVRLILMLKSSVLLFALLHVKKVRIQYTHRFQRSVSLLKKIGPLYGFIILLTVVFNLIGMVNLAEILLSGVLISVALGTVVFLAVQIMTNMLLLVFQIRKVSQMHALSVMVEATTKRFQPIIAFFGLLLWVMFTLRGFDIYDNIMEWGAGLLDISWEVGQTEISLGSILSFSTLLIVSLLLAKMVASIFQDDWMIQVLPRGAAPAISLILRISVISIGVYMAFSAAGFDLSKLGIVFGALSVGIGFGLQNVVLNFIAGLVLAFERPINIGDAIEVDNEMGEVMNIGVRSSHIRTYSGAEAIIPNGDLISKKVVNWTLSDRDRRSKIDMRTSAAADPNQIIELFNTVANAHPNTFSDPAPKTYFYGYGEDGNLKFSVLYWSTFSDTLKANSEISLRIFNELKKAGIEAPMPNQRNFD